MDEAGVWRLKDRVEKEVAEARGKGYLPLDVGNALKEAENLLRKYRSTKSWEKGYWGRAENYDLGFDVDRERLLLEAVEHLLRAKGALISLKLPRWVKDLRYYYMDAEWGREGVESLDAHRGVVFMSGREWALEGFPRTQSFWYRCSCRPTVDGIQLIEKHHAEGRRVGTYMSGGMMAITSHCFQTLKRTGRMISRGLMQVTIGMVQGSVSGVLETPPLSGTRISPSP